MVGGDFPHLWIYDVKRLGGVAFAEEDPPPQEVERLLHLVPGKDVNGYAENLI
jgi:hypothetical protein